MKKCNKCGGINEADVRFCVSCGDRLVSNDTVSLGHSSTARAVNNQHHNPNVASGHSYAETHRAEQVTHAPNPLEVIWTDFLFSERMIVIGAAMGLVASIMVVVDGGTNFLSAAVYFAAMSASLTVLYLSINAPVTKKIELARWQIAIGAFFMLSLSSVYYLIGAAMGTTVGSFDMYDFSQLLTLISSALILIGAIKLQGELLRQLI